MSDIYIKVEFNTEHLLSFPSQRRYDLLFSKDKYFSRDYTLVIPRYNSNADECHTFQVNPDYLIDALANLEVPEKAVSDIEALQSRIEILEKALSELKRNGYTNKKAIEC